MARISNTTAYPNIGSNLDANDFFILTDAENSNKTKSCKVSTLQTLFGLNTLVANVSITSAELLNLRDIGKTLISAPGAGKVIDILSLDCYVDNKGVVYDFNQALTIDISTQSFGNVPIATINSATDVVRKIAISTGDIAPNTALMLNTTGAVSQGNGLLYFNISYRILTIGSSF